MFEKDGLPDGTEVAYYSRGQVLERAVIDHNVLPMALPAPFQLNTSFVLIYFFQTETA